MEDLCAVTLILYTLHESRGEEKMNNKESIELFLFNSLLIITIIVFVAVYLYALFAYGNTSLEDCPIWVYWLLK